MIEEPTSQLTITSGENLHCMSGFHPEGIILGGGEAPGNGRGFIYFPIQMSQILGGRGGKLPPAPPMKPFMYIAGLIVVSRILDNVIIIGSVVDCYI